jgi:hypothetical protein
MMPPVESNYPKPEQERRETPLNVPYLPAFIMRK